MLRCTPILNSILPNLTSEYDGGVHNLQCIMEWKVLIPEMVNRDTAVYRRHGWKVYQNYFACTKLASCTWPRDCRRNLCCGPVPISTKDPDSPFFLKAMIGLARGLGCRYSSYIGANIVI